MKLFFLLLKRDILCLMRSKGAIAVTLSLSLLSLLVVTLVVRDFLQCSQRDSGLSAGFLYPLYLFVSSCFFQHFALAEGSDCAIVGLLLSPAAPSLVFLSRFFCNFFALSCLNLLLMSAYFIALNSPFGPFPLDFALLVVIFSAAIASLGTFLSYLLVERGGWGGGVLIFSLSVSSLFLPPMLCALAITGDWAEQGRISYFDSRFILLCAYDTLSLYLFSVLFDRLSFD